MILGVVLLGTLYPLLVEAVTGEKLSVGAPYFNAVAGPLALILVALLLIGPRLRWRRDSEPVLGRIAIPALIAVGALLVSWLAAPRIGLLPRFGLALAAALAFASLTPLFGRKLLRAPLAVWGMVIAHFGVAVALAGMAADSAFTRETLAVARVDDRMAVGPWVVRLAKLDPVVGPNWTAIEATLRASRGEGAVVLKPQTRAFSDPPTETNEAAIHTGLDGQLYAVIGRQDPDGRWQVRLWWKPFVTLIGWRILIARSLLHLLAAVAPRGVRRRA